MNNDALLLVAINENLRIALNEPRKFECLLFPRNTRRPYTHTHRRGISCPPVNSSNSKYRPAQLLLRSTNRVRTNPFSSQRSFVSCFRYDTSQKRLGLFVIFVYRHRRIYVRTKHARVVFVNFTNKPRYTNEMKLSRRVFRSFVRKLFPYTTHFRIAPFSLHPNRGFRSTAGPLTGTISAG